MDGCGGGGLIRFGLVLLSLLGLAGCGTGPSSHVCAPELVATLPLSAGSHLVVEGKLNQQPARFVLDTGAEASHVTPYAVTHFNLARGRGQTTITGVGGRVVTGNAFGNIELGGLEVRRQLSVVGLPFTPREGPPYAGLLGADLLSAYDMEVSVPERVVRLWRAEHCEGDYVPWTRRHSAVPLRRTIGGRLLLTATLDGQDLRALLDTGANVTILSGSGADRMHLTESGMATDRQGQGRGVDGNAVGSRLHRFETLTIGSEQLRRPRLNVSGITISDGDMLLGLDWLRLRPVWISWSSRQMFMQPLRAEPPPPEPPTSEPGKGMPAARQAAMVPP